LFYTDRPVCFGHAAPGVGTTPGQAGDRFLVRSETRWPEREYIAHGKVALVFRHLPLPFHRSAALAGAAAECAGGQSQFWLMHDRLFERGGPRRASSCRPRTSEGATPPVGMQRPANAGRLPPRAARRRATIRPLALAMGLWDSRERRPMAKSGARRELFGNRRGGGAPAPATHRTLTWQALTPAERLRRSWRLRRRLRDPQRVHDAKLFPRP
jgi:hypothetical protein